MPQDEYRFSLLSGITIRQCSLSELKSNSMLSFGFTSTGRLPITLQRT
jgi:hypothetical protein